MKLMNRQLFFCTWMTFSAISFANQDNGPTLKEILGKRFGTKNVELIVKQHPDLTVAIANDLMWSLGKIEATQALSEEEALSKFTMRASMVVGFSS